MNRFPGDVIGPYEIKRVFESGGMGTVYQVRHQKWEMDVAIKVVKAQFASDLSFIAEFEHEAETWANIGLHPYVASCYFTQRIEGSLCLCGEFVEGGSLQDWIRNRCLYRAETAAVVSTILQIAAGFALGLDWAHQHRLVHQDVKPGNLLMTPDGTPKIADFGLARSMKASGKAKAAGYTSQFASPEQLSGLPVTPATDVWSWAVSVLHMFMGDVYWESGLAAPAVLADYCSRHRRMPGLPQMPQQVCDLLEGCFVFDPDKRLSNFCSLAQSLSEIHAELFGEQIVFAEHGTPELAADSLNNRAVSLLEVGRENEAEAMLDRLVSSMPEHVEGNFNQLLLMAGRGQITWSQMKVRLALLVANQPDDSLAELQKKAETALRERMKLPQWPGSPQNLPFVLARPKSGAEHQYEGERFNRLISKAAAALESGNANEARRYLRMSMDIEGFSSHPKLRVLAAALD